ncbi:MAG: site-2 protease family protein [Candidatus Aenigmatarchaeota archaeon]
MVDVYQASMIIFFVIVGIWAYFDRKNIEFKYIILLRKTKKGLKLLDKIAKFKKFWKAVGIIAIISCFIMMVEGLRSFVQASLMIISGEIKESLGGLVLPTPTATPVFGPGFIGIPFLFWIIILPTILFPHEIAHGIMCRLDKIKVKSAGIILLLVLPGAFVEPDENEIKKSKLLTKLRIFSAGSFANLIVAFLIFTPFLGFGLLPNVIWPSIATGYLKIVEVNSTAPAGRSGLETGMVITEINGNKVEVNYINFLLADYLTKYTKGVKVGDIINITANGKLYEIPVEGIKENNSTRPFIGINVRLDSKCDETTFYFITNLFTWMWVLNYAVAIFNILPIYPLDGGLILNAIAEKYAKKYQEKIVISITAITALLALFTIIGPYIMTALRSF